MPLNFRYVRQDSALWQELHAGVLTTGKLNSALGLKEPWAARLINGPKASPGAINKYGLVLNLEGNPS